MKKNLLIGMVTVLAGSLLAANSSPKNEVKNAAAALGRQANYSWTTTVEVANNSRFKPGPTEGKTEKNGYTTLSMSFGDNTSEAIFKGTNGAIKLQDQDWQSFAEAMKAGGDGGFNPAVFIARMAQTYKTPAVEAADLAGETKDLKNGTNGISGDLTEAGAKELLSFRWRGGNGPDISNAKGSAAFWLKAGALEKYQFHVSGTVSFNGNDHEVDRTTTVEIKSVNATKISIPGDAKKKLQ